MSQGQIDLRIMMGAPRARTHLIYIVSCLLLHRRSTQNATAEALNLWQLRMRLINILLLGHEECALEYNNFDRARIPPFEFEEGSLAR